MGLLVKGESFLGGWFQPAWPGVKCCKGGGIKFENCVYGSSSAYDHSLVYVNCHMS